MRVTWDKPDKLCCPDAGFTPGDRADDDRRVAPSCGRMRCVGGAMAGLPVRLSDAINRARIVLTTPHSARYLAARGPDFAGFARGTLLITAGVVLTTIFRDFAIDPVNSIESARPNRTPE